MNQAPSGEIPVRDLLVRPVAVWRPWAVGLLFGLILVPLSARPRHSGNVWSRYMTIESIVERGTMAVDRSPLRAISGSPDLIRVEGHFYSDKPPVLSALAAVIYAPLWAAGLRFSASAASFATTNWILVSIFSGGGSILAVAGLRRWLQVAPLSPWLADLMAVLLAVCSPLLVYGVTFNNHSVAAGLLSIALTDVLLAERKKPSPGKLLRVGLLVGLATVVDIPAGGAVLIGLTGFLIVKEQRVPWSLFLGVVPPLLLHAALQFSVTGSPLPAELTPRVFEYPGSYWLTEAGRWREPGPRWKFALDMLAGYQGWLTVCPALVVGVGGLAWFCTRRGDPLRGSAMVVGLILMVLVVNYVWVVRRTDFAGQSFGTRHLLPMVPTVLAFSVITVARFARRGAWVALAVLVLIGGVYAHAGMLDPWSRVENRDDSMLGLVKRLTPYPWSTYQR